MKLTAVAGTMPALCLRASVSARGMLVVVMSETILRLSPGQFIFSHRATEPWRVRFPAVCLSRIRDWALSSLPDCGQPLSERE